MTGDASIIDSVRTPSAKFNGALAGPRPADLAAVTLQALVPRRAKLDPASVDDVLLGNANGAGEENRHVAGVAVLVAGWQTSVPNATVNRLCGSGMEAVIQARRAIAIGDGELIVAGGIESTTRVPWAMSRPDRPFPRGHQSPFSTTSAWRLVNRYGIGAAGNSSPLNVAAALLIGSASAGRLRAPGCGRVGAPTGRRRLRLRFGDLVHRRRPRSHCRTQGVVTAKFRQRTGWDKRCPA